MEKERYNIPEDTPQMVSETVAVRDSFHAPISVDKSPAMKSYERARADVEAGRIVKCKNKEDFFAKLGL